MWISVGKTVTETLKQCNNVLPVTQFSFEIRNKKKGVSRMWTDAYLSIENPEVQGPGVLPNLKPKVLTLLAPPC